MPFRSALFAFLFVAMISHQIPISAQERHYHVELSDGTSSRVILVNESHKPIEAFHFAGKCGNFATQQNYDALDFSGGPNSIHSVPGLHGETISQRSVLDSFGPILTSITLLPQPGGCAWKTEIDAVIYSDGTYEGTEAGVRNLQARRDGIVSAVKYWLDRFDEQRLEKFAPEAAQPDAKRMAHQDMTRTVMTGSSKSLIECAYWSGRQQVDANVALQGQYPKDNPGAGYKKMVQTVDDWQRKIESNAALKELDVVFSLPTAIREQELSH